MGIPVLFGGLVGMAIGAGNMLTRILAGDEAAAKSVLEELEDEVKRKREAHLDNLYKRLSQDDDPRDENFLKDLREMANAFRDRSLWPDTMSTHTVIDIMAGVDELFEGCVNSLERGLVMVEMANKMGTDEARQPILEERERVLKEVAASLEQLTKVFTGMQALRATAGADEGMQSIRDELNRSLEIAARVEERMSQWSAGQHDLDLENP